MKSISFDRSAEVVWHGDVIRGSGVARAGSGAFEIQATFPTMRGEPASTTTPEELLAASHAACYAIGLRSVIARRGGSVARVVVTATITAEKGSGRLRIVRSHLAGIVDQLQGIDAAALAECAEVARVECTISNALRDTIEITHEVNANVDAID